MINNKKIAPYIFVFLAFCVISSKHIIIYNEEILVALSFLFFVVFVSYYFGDNIKESLDERSNTIKLELQNFLNLKKDSLHTLYKIHEKAFSSEKFINNLMKFTDIKITNKIKGSEKALKNLFAKEIYTKLKNLSNSNVSVKYKFQEIISQQLLEAVLTKNQRKSMNRNIQLDMLKKTGKSIL